MKKKKQVTKKKAAPQKATVRQKERRGDERIRPQGFLAVARVGDFEYRTPIENISMSGMLVLGYAAPLQEQPTRILLQNSKHQIEIPARAVATRKVEGRIGVAYTFTAKKTLLRGLLRDLQKNSTR